TRNDVLIVGAGPAGLGCAVALKACGVENLAILDRRGVGAAFEHWPAQMRMITPSFHSNPFGQVDLNAITPQTSVADYLGREHPSGEDLIALLEALPPAVVRAKALVWLRDRPGSRWLFGRSIDDPVGEPDRVDGIIKAPSSLVCIGPGLDPSQIRGLVEDHLGTRC
ncbi:MAG: NAD(P)-binding domain-containing protein, partial [Verrucomicrobia bacterium]|nr:NAD(P)-binding domain-containing protein [Verrucomicrobiota bacterium]